MIVITIEVPQLLLVINTSMEGPSKSQKIKKIQHQWKAHQNHKT